MSLGGCGQYLWTGPGLQFPVLKKGELRMCSNYKVIALLTLPAKAYAKMLERKTCKDTGEVEEVYPSSEECLRIMGYRCHYYKSFDPCMKSCSHWAMGSNRLMPCHQFCLWFSWTAFSRHSQGMESVQDGDLCIFAGFIRPQTLVYTEVVCIWVWSSGNESNYPKWSSLKILRSCSWG